MARSSFLVVLLLSYFATLSFALYSPSDKVVVLTPDTFSSKVLKSDAVWLIEFFAPWCGHCKSLVPEWKKAAEALHGIVHVGAVDMDAHPNLGAPYDIKGFPTIKLFGANKNKPIDFGGARTAGPITEFALKEARNVVQARLGGRGSSGGSSSSSGSGSGSGSGGGKRGPSKVVELTDSNFDELVLQTDDLWVVEFFAPWCGHCKNLAPHWEKAASELDGSGAKLGAVDATIHTSLAGRYGIKGYPTIKVFKGGEKQRPSDYEGGRTSDAIVSYVRTLAEASIKPRPVVQLLDESTFKENCQEGGNLCLIAFLPHILDSSAKQRNGYINVLKHVADKAAKRGFGYVWTEAGSHPELEAAFASSFYPGLVALNAKKSRFSPMVGAFSEDTILDFIKRLVNGREPTTPLSAVPAIQTVDKWNGKDGEKPVSSDDDIDLSDIIGTSSSHDDDL